MSQPLSDQVQTRRALAALAACIVQTLHESDSTVRPNFERHLSRLYRHVQDQGGDDLAVLELLKMTQEALDALGP